MGGMTAIVRMSIGRARHSEKKLSPLAAQYYHVEVVVQITRTQSLNASHAKGKILEVVSQEM
jgi:hypothetical protein